MDVNVLEGKTLRSIVREEENDDDCRTLTFTTDNDEVYSMFHSQDCCEDVRLQDICGDLEDLVGVPILIARKDTKEDEDGQALWTFYNFSTIKGSVTLRWYGAASYYSLEVDFEKIS